jgi:hypothetical protein
MATGREPDREMIFVGPFLTRRQAVSRSGMGLDELAGHPGVLRLSGDFAVEEVYPAYQFTRNGLRNDLATVVERFNGQRDAWSICDWITRPLPDLGGKSPLRWLDEGGKLPSVLSAVPG